MWVYRGRRVGDPNSPDYGKAYYEVGYYEDHEWVGVRQLDEEVDAQIWVSYLNGGRGAVGVTPS